MSFSWVSIGDSFEIIDNPKYTVGSTVYYAEVQPFASDYTGDEPGILAYRLNISGGKVVKITAILDRTLQMNYMYAVEGSSGIEQFSEERIFASQEDAIDYCLSDVRLKESD